MTDPSIETCIKYESIIDVKKMELVKIEKVTAARSVRSKKFPVFSAKHGVEGLYHVTDRYLKSAEELEYGAVDKWNSFDEVLDTVAQSKWGIIIANITPNLKTNQHFETEWSQLVETYAEGKNLRDKMIKYIKT